MSHIMQLFASTRIRSAGRSDEHPEILPPAIARLARREREVAAIVHTSGGATAHDVRAAMSAELTNGAIRSMLNRLVAKGLLSRRRSGRGKELIYLPVIASDAAIEHAFKTFADEFFEGSCEHALAKLETLFTGPRRVPSLATTVRRDSRKSNITELSATRSLRRS